MNYLKITNQGLICAEDLMLIGSSTKREQTNKIGMFGSGWKYSLAWLLRNECQPVIYAGLNQINVDFNIKLHRNNPVNVITVDGQETSLTTEMGPKWTGWMSIREVLSNAIDEGNHSITTVWLPEFRGFEDQTTIYIPMNGELSDVMLKFDSYFALHRKASYETENCRLFFKTEASNMNIYRKGIRCFDTTKQTKIDFDFSDVYISEDRLTSDYYINSEIKDIVSSDIPAQILRRIIDEEQSSWLPEKMNEFILQNCIELIKLGDTFTTNSIRKLGGMLFSDPNALIIPAEWYKKLQDLGFVKNIFELDDNIEFIRTDERNVEGIHYHLSTFGIKIELRSGKCEYDCFVSKNIGYVKDNTIEDDKIIAVRLIKKMSENYLLSYLK